MDLGGYLEQEREQRGLSKRAFALALGISNGEYTKILRHDHAPRLETLDKLSRQLEISLPSILELAGYDLRVNRETPAPARLAALLKLDPRLQGIAPLIARLSPEEQHWYLLKLEQDFAAAEGGRSGG